MVKIQKGTRTGRFINRSLAFDVELECGNCRWSGTRKDALRDLQSILDPNIAAKIGTAQKTQIDLYCPSCGHFIITYCEDD